MYICMYRLHWNIMQNTDSWSWRRGLHYLQENYFNLVILRIPGLWRNCVILPYQGLCKICHIFHNTFLGGVLGYSSSCGWKREHPLSCEKWQSQRKLEILKPIISIKNSQHFSTVHNLCTSTLLLQQFISINILQNITHTHTRTYTVGR